jgi:hypothetical protein
MTDVVGLNTNEHFRQEIKKSHFKHLASNTVIDKLPDYD